MAAQKKAVTVRGKVSEKEKERIAERKRHRGYTHTRKGMKVFGKESVTRMIRVNVKYADQLAARAKKAGKTLPEYTATLAK